MAEANARLIAAAPEMLEALINAEDGLCMMIDANEPGGVHDRDLRRFIKQVRAAIAKAEGRE